MYEKKESPVMTVISMAIIFLAMLAVMKLINSGGEQTKIVQICKKDREITYLGKGDLYTEYIILTSAGEYTTSMWVYYNLRQGGVYKIHTHGGLWPTMGEVEAAADSSPVGHC